MLPQGIITLEQCLVAAWMVMGAWVASSLAKASPSGLYEIPQSTVLPSSSYM